MIVGVRRVRLAGSLDLVLGGGVQRGAKEVVSAIVRLVLIMLVQGKKGGVDGGGVGIGR